jgi:hypothetical protein
MSNIDHAHQHTLMCLRLAAECKTLADDVGLTEVRDRYLLMADMWTAFAGVPPHVLH